MLDNITADFIAYEASLDVSHKELDAVCRQCSNSLILDFDDGIVFCSHCGPCYRINPPANKSVTLPANNANDGKEN